MDHRSSVKRCRLQICTSRCNLLHIPRSGGFIVGATTPLITGQGFGTALLNGLETGAMSGLSGGLKGGLNGHMGLGSKALNFFVVNNLMQNVDAFHTHRLSLTLGPVSVSYNEDNNSFSAKSIFNKNHNNGNDYLNYGLSTLYALEGFGETAHGLKANNLTYKLRTFIADNVPGFLKDGNPSGSYGFEPAIIPLINYADQRYFKSKNDFF